ncbi:MAG: hypothetical protein JJU02_15550 [Cryomorphaceae bacterium]|nr:hypothetical protein [Cryomorphaceae bacterium]
MKTNKKYPSTFIVALLLYGIYSLIKDFDLILFFGLIAIMIFIIANYIIRSRSDKEFPEPRFLKVHKKYPSSLMVVFVVFFVLSLIKSFNLILLFALIAIIALIVANYIIKSPPAKQ